MSQLTAIQTIAVAALPLLFAITLHEVAHGWVARRLGDPTAALLGRLSFNPLKHIDPIGTVVVPLVLLMLGGFIFGWAKPVPVTYENLRNPKRDMAIVAAAGPMANLLMALFWVGVVMLGLALGQSLAMPAQFLIYMGEAGITLNVMLMVLNLLPLPPLDGGRVLAGFLPGPWAYKLSRIEPYGFIILLVLLATGILGKILGPIIGLVNGLLIRLVGV